MKLSEFKQNIATEKNYLLESKSNTSSEGDLKLILDVVKNINSSLIQDDVLALVLTNAIEITDSERGFIVLCNEEGELEYKLGLNSNGVKLPEHFFNISTSVVEDVFFTGLSKFVEGALSDTNNAPSKSILNLSLQTILCSPLTTGEKKIGVIYVDSKHLKSINKKEITYTFEILAGQAAIAINNAKLYEDLNSAKEKAEKSDNLKSEFLAQMSHEIRTPLNVLLNSSSLLREDVEEEMQDAGVGEYFNIIDSAGKRITRTIDLVLNMSQIQTDSYDFNSETFNLKTDIIDHVCKELRCNAEEKNLEISVIDKADKKLLTADEYSVKQIFNNLIDNAIKFTNKGSVEIEIMNDDHDNIVVEVRDTGIGISEEYLPKLFESFTQEDHGYTRNFDGNGLGLTLVQRYCELNDAEIFVESERGVGSTFRVTFRRNQ